MNIPKLEIQIQIDKEEFNSIKNNDKEYIVIPKTPYIDNILNGRRCGKIIIYNSLELLYIDDVIEKRFETISKIGINELQLLISRDEEVKLRNRYRYQEISQFYVLYFKK